MSRKRTLTCDRCGFTEEEVSGEYTTIECVSMAFGPTAFGPTTGSVGRDFFDAQDMCRDCREAVKDQLLALFKRGNERRMT